DLTDDNTIDRAVGTIVAESGGIFGLVNNAGRDLRNCFEDVTEAEMRGVYDVNVFETMTVTQRVLSHLHAARRGRIVTITSVGDRIASLGLSGYYSTKFALKGFAKALTLEVAPFDLRSIIIEPEIVKTPL